MTIASIRQRVAAATPGPWSASYGHVWWTPADAPEFPLASLETDDDHYGFRSTPERKSSDATFIAHARTDVELLLAVAEAAKVARQELARMLHAEDCRALWGPNEWDEDQADAEPDDPACDCGIKAAYRPLADALAALEAGA